MRIGIDIDDVITDTSLPMQECINEYNTESNMEKDITAHIEEVMRGEMPTTNIKKFFEDNIISIYKKTKVKENASQVIQRLLDAGNEVYIITARGEEKFKDSEKFTLEYLKSNNINYTKILFNSFQKDRVCEENKIDIMVDDSIKHCTEVSKKNIRTILFTSIVNKSIETTIERVDNWLELEKKINEQI